MATADQPDLIDLPEQPARPQSSHSRGALKLRTVNRQQTMLVQMDVEELIPPDHKARAIWELVGRLDLSSFAAPLQTERGCVGRPAWDPHLLVSLWVYAYSEGIGSARELERLMEWEPGLQWLGGLATVNAHTLSDFRVVHREALERLFAKLLVVLEEAGLVELEQVMHDGTKIRAQAGVDTFRREKSLRERVEQARQLVQQMEEGCEEGARDRRQAAQQRAAREQVQRMELALQEVQALQAEKRSAEEKAAVRVSITEPEARIMKQGNGGLAPSYNAQISTDAAHKVIVGAHLTQCSSDAESLMPAIEQIEENLEKPPKQAVVDGGFTNRETIRQCAAKTIDLVGSLPSAAERSEAAMKAQGIDPAFAPQQFRVLEEGPSLECPGGCRLEYVRQSRKRGDAYRQYQARGADCQACRHQPRCCPHHPASGRTVSIRVEEVAEVAAFRKKMERAEYRAIYRRRGEVAEFPNAWLKDKLGLTKFHVRGLVKAGSELIWACLTYNMMQWVRLVWRKTLKAAATA